MVKAKYTKCIVGAGSHQLAPNSIWNVPDAPVNDVRFDMTFQANDPHHRITKVKGLAMTRDGYIFGWKTLSRPQEESYSLTGRISIGGKKYRAFTSSHLFIRPDGSLCNVALLIVCGWGE